MKHMWWRLVAFGFRLLYNEMAWTYDAVSWVVSLGHWRAWQQCALRFLPARGRILEVGSGPGHLLIDLRQAGYEPVGLDLSRAMLGQARRRLRRRRCAAPLCRGATNALPFGPGTFDAIVATFPTNYVYEAVWIEQVGRVLKAGGRLVVVERASLRRDDPAARGIELLYEITGQRGSGSDLASLLEAGGLRAWTEVVAVEGTRVRVVIAEAD